MNIRIRKILLVFAITVLAGCGTDEKYNVSQYIKTFDHVHTDQFVWSSTTGGIYWVDDEHILLEAEIKKDSGGLDRGIYQVRMIDGFVIKVVDVPDDGPFHYNYCFEGQKLHVMVQKGAFALANEPKNYLVEIKPEYKKKRGRRYSKLRCDFVDIPQTKLTGYLPLKVEDGMIKNKAKEGSDNVSVFLTDDIGNEVREISGDRLDEIGVNGVRSFVPHLNAYFGKTPFKNNCTILTHVYRHEWTLTQEQLCIEGWVFGGRLISRLKNGYYVEHKTHQKGVPKSYIFVGENRIPVEIDQVESSSVSPNGCLVAYGVGNNVGGAKKTRQKLRILNYCEFKERELKQDHL